jgi:hypothetical protein
MSTPKRKTPDLTSLGAQSLLGNRRQLYEYNYEHFRPKHLLADLWKTLRGEGLQPGAEAPDFEMETTEGGLASPDRYPPAGSRRGHGSTSGTAIG